MPIGTDFTSHERYAYLNGFSSYHQLVCFLNLLSLLDADSRRRSEAVKGALPEKCITPQKAPYGLYTEKLSGTAFTAPRAESLQSWLYRILPSAAHSPFVEIDDACSPTGNVSRDMTTLKAIPNQLRWDPFNIDEGATFIEGLRVIAGAGNARAKSGLNIMIYSAGKSMGEEAFYSADGDFLIVPQHGPLDIQTEFGLLFVRPNEICVIPRGIKYRVMLPEGPVRGYICEVYQGHFVLPELGPIGSFGLANVRDFQVPTAHFDDDDGHESKLWKIITKFNHHFFLATQPHCPFDVVAWHGSYYPYKYDLGRFGTIGSISHSHPDPSIFTVLTAQSDHPGTAIVDFAIFPPRWLVAEETFRPPWYHRNTMSEFMGLINGNYDAKEGGGFVPGGASLHNTMSGHGPDATTFEMGSNAELKPMKVGEGHSCLACPNGDWKAAGNYKEHTTRKAGNPLRDTLRIRGKGGKTRSLTGR
ncbi:hypothetical protein KEM54_000972 [Ascosphaera aggregata]|nr:hypothetical protein KEM54_000972 [Ascosphaera aggregata]